MHVLLMYIIIIPVYCYLQIWNACIVHALFSIQVPIYIPNIGLHLYF